MISTTKVYTFRSSSSPEKVYTTLLLSDGSTTCNCPGWTRRVGVNGGRLCVHTRLVNSGNAEADPLYVSDADIYVSYPTQDYKPDAPTGVRLRGISKEPQPKPGNGLPRRKFSFE